MSLKLLDKSLRVYVLLSVAILLISAPLFYFLATKLFIDDADETLYLHKKEFVTRNLPSIKINEIPLWNKISRDVKIEPYSPGLKKDSIFYTFYLDTLASENEPYRVLISPITIEGRPCTFLTRVDLIESDDLIQSIAILYFLILTFLLTGLYFITRRLSYKLWLPFYSTLQLIERFELENPTLPNFTSTDVEEFSRLNESIKRLLEKNLSVYQEQKEFTENAAHELQTPLAIFQAKLDILVQQIPITSELSKILSSLHEAIARLNRINKNLLLLSKIENNQYDNSANVSVSELLKNQIEFFIEQAEEKHIHVKVEKIDILIIEANAALVDSSVSNLLLNAIRHNTINGKIRIDLHNRTLLISNTSDHGALQTNKLFQRFFKSSDATGNGLGLAIVKKICDINNWTLLYKYESGEHHFELKF